MSTFIPSIEDKLRSHILHVPEAISRCSGIKIFGKLIRSLVFTTDISIICNTNADAVLAVYPFTPQLKITRAILSASDIPVFSGVGGGITRGTRVINNARGAENAGAFGVVVNSPTSNEVISLLAKEVEIPVITTIVSDSEDFAARIEAGTDIFNVSAAASTPDVVRHIRSLYPEFPIIATGGPTEQSILNVIAAGANAVTWTPPKASELMQQLMAKYRNS